MFYCLRVMFSPTVSVLKGNRVDVYLYSQTGPVVGLELEKNKTKCGPGLDNGRWCVEVLGRIGRRKDGPCRCPARTRRRRRSAHAQQSEWDGTTAVVGYGRNLVTGVRPSPSAHKPNARAPTQLIGADTRRPYARNRNYSTAVMMVHNNDSRGPPRTIVSLGK